MTILVTIWLTLLFWSFIETLVLKFWIHKVNNQSYLTWEDFVEAARKDGICINIKNDDKSNDVDKFFNGEVVHVDFSPKIDDPDFELPGETRLQFVKDN